VADPADYYGLEQVLLIEVHFAKVPARCLAPPAVAQGIDMKWTTEMAILTKGQKRTQKR